MNLTVLAKHDVAAETVCVALGHTDGAPLPPFRPGAHIEITVGGLMRRYSLTSRPEVSAAYEITVLRVSPSRGGSAYIHDRLRVGDTLDASEPVNAFPLNEAAAHSIFIAGGIGVTPFLSMMEALTHLQRSFECHYAVARADRMIPVPDHEGRLARYVSTNGATRLNIDTLIQTLNPLSDLYVCGPTPMIEVTRDLALARGWARAAIHYESFGGAPRTEDRAITLHLLRSNVTFEIAVGTSILDALLEHDIWAPFDCKRGECATCVATVLAGVVDHRDVCLKPAQRAQNMCICVSWSTSDSLTLDL